MTYQEKAPKKYYPETDEKNWRCHTIAYLDGEGISFKKKDVIYTRLKPEDAK